MYNYNKYSSIITKSFTKEIMGSMGFTVQFGVFTNNNQEKTLVFSEYSDSTRDYFHQKAKSLVGQEAVLFSYFVTTAILRKKSDETELLIIVCSDAQGESSEITFKITRDYKSRVTQLKRVRLNNRIFHEYGVIAH